MSRPSIWHKKKARLAVFDKFKQTEDVKLHIQLPDYGDFQGYYLGRDGALNHVARKIYANFHKPPSRTLKRRLFSVKITKNLNREINAIAENDKKTIPNRNEFLAA